MQFELKLTLPGSIWITHLIYTEQHGAYSPPRWKLLIISQLNQHRAPVSERLYNTGCYHGCVLRGWDHPQPPGDCGDSEAQTAEAAAQLCPGELGHM